MKMGKIARQKTLIVNHINSTPRESLVGRTPYSVALKTLSEKVLNAFQLRPIAPDEVNLTPTSSHLAEICSKK